MARYTVVTMPGDGIGKVVLPEALKVLEAVGFDAEQLETVTALVRDWQPVAQTVAKHVTSNRRIGGGRNSTRWPKTHK